MIQTLQGQLESLRQMAVTIRDIDQEPLSVGMRLTLRIYTQILDDGLSVLRSMIDYLETHQGGHGEKP